MLKLSLLAFLLLAAPADPCAIPQTSAVDTIARAIASGIGRIPRGATVATVALESDEAAPRASELSTLVVEQVAGRLGLAYERSPVTAEEALQSKPPGVILLRPRIERGRLRVTADAHAVPTTIWDRATKLERGPVAHAHAQAAIDAEIRAYLAPLGLGEPAVARFEGADPDIKAIACGDLDGDGETDVITMNRERILRVRLAEGQVKRLLEARWDELAPIAPVPLRDPLGFLTIANGHLDAALSDRRGSARLDPHLEPTATLEGKAVPHGGGTACTFLHDLRLSPRLAPCREGDPAPAIADLRHPADAMASTLVVDQAGKARTLVALRKDGTLVLRDGERDSFIARTGAQIAVGDIDQDGEAELVSTIDTLAPKQDAVELRSLDRGTVKLRRRVPVPTGVEAVAICPPDRPAAPAPVVVATAGELWVIR